MKKVLLPLSLLMLCACNISPTPDTENVNKVEDYTQDKETNSSQFDFNGNYDAPELRIDGIEDDEQWQQASPILNFGEKKQASVKMYRGEKGLFCFFRVEDDDIQTIGNNNGDDVNKGDSIEIYFDFKNDASNKVQSDDIQINIGVHGKTRILVGNNGQWGAWNGLLDYTIKLDGTLNDDKDVDVGYTIELMIPYAQAGIDRYSSFGIALGHVERGRGSTHDTLPYTWGGIVYEGNFVDPQVPSKYIVYHSDNKFYSRENVPIDNIVFDGSIVDQNNNSVSGVNVAFTSGEQAYNATSDANGKYVISNFNPNAKYDVTFTKEGYKTYTRSLTSNELKAGDAGHFKLNTLLVNESFSKEVVLKGIVKNPTTNEVENAKVALKDVEAYTNTSGQFEMTIVIDNDLVLEISKDSYRSSTVEIDSFALLGKQEIDIGVCELYSPSSYFTFGGSRGIQKILGEVYRGFEGINFTFKSETPLSGGDHIELFVDTKTSFHGRDDTDYRIDFKGDGGIGIVNFGNGSNNIVSTSGIKNKVYLDKTTYIFDTFIPYSFLRVTNQEIIGISLGIWNERLSDWDGWGFIGEGFAPYVAPEFTDQYTRISLDNGMYRALNNETYATRIYGVIYDENNNPTSGEINGMYVDESGVFNLYFVNNTSVTLTISKNGYNSQIVTYEGEQLNGTPIKLEVQLVKAVCIVSGSCNVNGAKVYYQENPEIFTYVENNAYSLEIPTTSNAHIVFEKEGYKTVNKGIGKASLVAKASANEPFVYNCVMEAL